MIGGTRVSSALNVNFPSTPPQDSFLSPSTSSCLVRTRSDCQATVNVTHFLPTHTRDSLELSPRLSSSRLLLRCVGMPKRKLPPQLAASIEARRKRRPEPISHLPYLNLRQLGEVNASQSPLLRLPVELRRKIWMNVIGHAIHLCSVTKRIDGQSEYFGWREDGRPREVVDENLPLQSYVCAAQRSDFQYYE